MRILYCNKYNYPFSGTEVYLFELMELMRSHGHEVALFSMADERGAATPYDKHFVPKIDFKAEAGSWRTTRRALHAIYSREARTRIRTMIQEFRPDVAHVRNIYHHLSPSILWELRAQNVPVIYHINDFKLLCPSYNLVSQGAVCEDCKGGAFWHALRPTCYPGLGARLTLTAEAYFHKLLKSYRKCVDLFLAPSNFVREKFVEHGWNNQSFRVLPHFQEVAPSVGCTFSGDAPILYFGRLSAEKGVADLLHAMRRLPNLRLIVAGDGPQRSELEALAHSLALANVEFVGQVNTSKLQQLIEDSRFTVFPSHAYETFGKSILESYARGRAVIASDLGSRRELVRDWETGLLYPTADVHELAKAIAWLSTKPELAQRMGSNGWQLIQQQFSPESHYREMAHLYESLRLKKSCPVTKVRLASTHTEPWKQRAPQAMHSDIACVQERPVAKARPLRIAFIGGRGVVSKYSGIESFYEEVGAELTVRGHEVTVYCRNYFTPRISEYRGMQILRLPTIRSKHLETLIHTFLSTMHAVTKPYDVVHYQALGPALFSFMPRMFGKKSVVTVQGLDWQRKKWGRLASAVLRLGERASAHFPSTTMVVSRTLQDRYWQLHRKSTVYIPNAGLLRERQEPQKILEWGLEPGNYILFLGRFSPEKGCHVLADAYEQIATDAKLVFAGASSYCDSYSRRLRERASKRIKVLDSVSGRVLDELLTNAMIFVLPSELEGLSLALLDAMGAGVCVVASDIPENREVVDGAGFTFSTGNAADLADRLRYLIANPVAREAAGHAAKNRIAELYQWQKIAADIEAAYLDLLNFTREDLAEESAEESADESRATTEAASQIPEWKVG
ncbi:MAG TPA: glycosyltransferase family 4 protein [Candidatus Sulfotelmatobacter sp.]|nr:glycosyltransferase family 4 protein [Candidatus Sulfotelmatobacter sp.]